MPHSYGLLHHLAHNLNRTLEVEALTPRQQLSLGSTNLTAGLHLLLSETGRVATSRISVAAQRPADGRRGSVDQAGSLAQAKALGMTDLNSGALFNAKFGIRHRGSTVPERSGAALSFRRRPAPTNEVSALVRRYSLVSVWLSIKFLITTVPASLSCQPCLRLSKAIQNTPKKSGVMDTKYAR